MAKIKEAPTQALSFPTRRYGTVTVVMQTYEVGSNCAVELVDDKGEPMFMLSVNLPESSHLLREREFFVKTWSENQEIAEDALASGIFRRTGRTSGGALNAPIWTF